MLERYDCLANRHTLFVAGRQDISRSDGLLYGGDLEVWEALSIGGSGLEHVSTGAPEL